LPLLKIFQPFLVPTRVNEGAGDEDEEDADLVVDGCVVRLGVGGGACVVVLAEVAEVAGVSGTGGRLMTDGVVAEGRGGRI
jgi:hypothetical protein